jgi:hypothetical protein
LLLSEFVHRQLCPCVSKFNVIFPWANEFPTWRAEFKDRNSS